MITAHYVYKGRTVRVIITRIKRSLHTITLISPHYLSGCATAAHLAVQRCNLPAKVEVQQWRTFLSHCCITPNLFSQCFKKQHI